MKPPVGGARRRGTAARRGRSRSPPARWRACVRRARRTPGPRRAQTATSSVDELAGLVGPPALGAAAGPRPPAPTPPHGCGTRTGRARASRVSSRTFVAFAIGRTVPAHSGYPCASEWRAGSPPWSPAGGEYLADGPCRGAARGPGGPPALGAPEHARAAGAHADRAQVARAPRRPPAQGARGARGGSCARPRRSTGRRGRRYTGVCPAVTDVDWPVSQHRPLDMTALRLISLPTHAALEMSGGFVAHGRAVPARLLRRGPRR